LTLSNLPNPYPFLAADDLVTVDSEQSYTRKYVPAVRTVSAGYHPGTITTNFKQHRSNTAESSSGDDGNSSNKSGDGFSKQRSFTTSILVSPQNNRKIFLPHQRSIEEQQQPSTKNYSMKINNSPEISSQTILQSGEVTIDIKKDQFYLPSPSSSEITHTTRISTGGSNNRDRLPPVPKSSSSSGTSTSSQSQSQQQQQAQQREQLYLNGLGLILSPSTDVSYV
jgi:hypothetical protein